MGLYEASKERFGFAYCMFSSLRRFVMKSDHYTKGNKKWRLQLSHRNTILTHDRFDATRWDQTLKELHEMGIDDFNELVTYDSKPAEYDTGTESSS